MTTPVYTRSEVPVEEVSIMWAVPRGAVVSWLDSGALGRSPAGTLTRNELVKFVESAEGRALINAARQ